MHNDAEFFPQQDHIFFIDGPAGKLELMGRGAASEKNLDDWLVIICHPHPQHQGTMHNKVVTTVARTAREAGLDSIRFNYRGVGQSEGEYGEFVGECEDFRAVLSWLKSNTEKKRFIFAGFSFGSAVVAVESRSIEGLAHSVLIAPSVENFPYPDAFDIPVSVIQGSEDEVVDVSAVRNWVHGLKSTYDFYYSSDTSHFFHGKLVELRYKLSSIFALTVA